MLIISNLYCNEMKEEKATIFYEKDIINREF